MIDVEQQLRHELDLLAPAVGPADWQEVLARAGHAQRPGHARLAAAVVSIAVLAAVGIATPLGAAVVHGLDGFSSWLTGEPGKPASRSDRTAFARANARSWLAFPASTQLRFLTGTSADGVTVKLLGFRSGDTLCLRVVLSGRARGARLVCAPLSELRHAGSPVRVVFVDDGFGRGTKHAWYGIQRIGSNLVQVTAGIAADGVGRVVVADQTGQHTLATVSNTFLYVAAHPGVGQRVRRIWAVTGDGRRLVVPFAPAPFGFPGAAGTQPVATGPTRIQRKVVGGTIGWLDRREPRGQPLALLPPGMRAFVTRHAVFGRLIAPDPSRPVRIAVTLATGRHGGRATGVCHYLVTDVGGGGGCGRRADLFAHGPVDEGLSLENGSDQFATVSGLASDDVARLVAFFSDHEMVSVPLVDNAFVVDIARSRFPVRLAAYDRAGRVIGLEVDRGFDRANVGPALGRARLLLRGRSSTGATAELFVGKSAAGGSCTYIRWHVSKYEAGAGEGCNPPDWSRSPLQLETPTTPALFVWGRVGQAVARVELHYADGSQATVEATEGYILYTVPAAHLRTGHALVAASALAADGRVIGSVRFTAPKR